MSPPRLLHIRGTAPLGGDALLIVELGRAARQAGFEVDVLATEPRFRELIREAGLGLVDLEVIRREIRPLWDARGLVRLTAFLSRSRYSIVHTHTSKPGMVGRLAATWTGAPAIIHTAHLFPFHEQTGRLATAAYVRAERLAARWCDRIVTVSEYHRDVGAPDGHRSGPTRSWPSPTACRPSGHGRRDRGRRSGTSWASEIGFLVLSTGRLAEQKGLEYLIRAAPLVRGGAAVRQVRHRGRRAARAAVRTARRRPRSRGDRAAASASARTSATCSRRPIWSPCPPSGRACRSRSSKRWRPESRSSRQPSAATGKSRTTAKQPCSFRRKIRRAWRGPSECWRRIVPGSRSVGRRGRAVQQERYTLGRMLEAYVHEYERLLRQRSPRASVSLFEAEGVS